MHDRPLAGARPETGEPGSGPLLSSDERAAAFAAGAPKVPRRTVVAVVAACLVLGLGGIVLDHFFSGADASTVTSHPGATNPSPLVTSPRSADLGAPISALMGLRVVTPRLAPSFSLVDQAGRAIELSQLRGYVVVLSFFDARCDDICPVLAAELRLAHADLGAKAARVVLVTVNSDPLATGESAAGPALHAGVSLADRWHFLTGSLRQLNRVWDLYGVTIDVQRTTGRISHTDVLYFIDTSGRLRARAIPFADESAAGHFSLPSAVEARWGEGIADEARSLVGRGS